MKWFRGAATDIMKPQAPKATQPKNPRGPKVVAPKKPKKQFTGPKSPDAYKRKLYVPKKFIQAGIELFAGNSDGSLEALRTLANMGIVTSIEWKSRSSDPCPKCDTAYWPSGGRWSGGDVVSKFLSDYRSGLDLDPGLSDQISSTIFHKNCNCYIRVTVAGSGVYDLYPGGSYELVGGGEAAPSTVQETPFEGVPMGRPEGVTELE